MLSSEDADEEVVGVREEAKIVVKEPKLKDEVKAVESFVDGDTGKSDPVVVQS